jgi:hypothetical protein
VYFFIDIPQTLAQLGVEMVFDAVIGSRLGKEVPTWKFA